MYWPESAFTSRYFVYYFGDPIAVIAVILTPVKRVIHIFIKIFYLLLIYIIQ